MDPHRLLLARRDGQTLRVPGDEHLSAGEDVRWLPRRQASELALPGNDFWLFDDHTVLWNHFTGDGASAGGEVIENPTAAKLCAEAFEAVWALATPHDQHEIH